MAYSVLGQVDYDIALQHHLQHNCCPSVPLICLEPVLEAIDAFMNGDKEKRISLPTGFEHTAEEIVETMNLQQFVAWQKKKKKRSTNHETIEA